MEGNKVSLQKVKQLAHKLGATVEDDKCGHTHECRVEAPKGKIWSSDFIHELIDSTNRPWRPDYNSLLSRMNYGVENCPDLECEWCNPEE